MPESRVSVKLPAVLTGGVRSYQEINAEIVLERLGRQNSAINSL